MPSLDPADASGCKAFRQCRFELYRFPWLHRIQMRDEFGKQAHAVVPHGLARLVPGLVLIEPPIGIARCLANIKTPSPSPRRIVEQHEIDRVVRAALSFRSCAEA